MSNTVRTILRALPAALLLLGACASPRGETPDEQRAAILAMHDEVLTDVYALDPSIEAEVAAAPGYGTFFNSKVTLLVATGGSGYGVVVNADTGRRTYMGMTQLGVALGAGFTEFKALFVFHDPGTLHRFITRGWEFGASADATAVDGDKGREASAAGHASSGITVYRVTESGLSAQVSATGSKYWIDEDLN